MSNLSISIPEQFRERFSTFIELPFEKRNEIISELNKQPYGTKPNELGEILKHELGYTNKEAVEIISSILSLISSKEDSKLEIESFITEISKALSEISIVIDDNFKETIVSLLSSRLVITNKLVDLVSSREKLIINTRIISDIRPIFKDEQNLAICCNALLHNIKIEFRENGKYKEMYFALDSDDLRKLKEQIIRTEKKEGYLKEQNDNIPLITSL